MKRFAASNASRRYQEADSPICELKPSTEESPLLFSARAMESTVGVVYH